MAKSLPPPPPTHTHRWVWYLSAEAAVHTRFSSSSPICPSHSRFLASTAKMTFFGQGGGFTTPIFSSKKKMTPHTFHQHMEKLFSSAGGHTPPVPPKKFTTPMPLQFLNFSKSTTWTKTKQVFGLENAIEKITRMPNRKPLTESGARQGEIEKIHIFSHQNQSSRKISVIW